MITPHSYQVPIIRDVVSALKRDGRTLMVMATGTGKTITSALVVQKLARKRGRMLFLCHNNDILRQSMDSYRDVFNGTRKLGEFTGDKKESAEFLFGSFQTMHGHRESFEPDEFDLIVVDESHHAQAETYRPTLEYFTPKYLLGMTATPDRMDGKDIREIFGEPTVELRLQEAIAKRFVAPVTYKLMTVGTASREALKRLKRRVGDGARISLRELNDNVFIENLDEDVAEEIMSHKGQGIIFCTSIQQAELMATRLKKAMPYHSAMSYEDCARELKAFRDKRLRYLLTVDKFNEGIDIPHAEVVVFLRSTESMTIFLQQLGRGLRKTKTKERVTVLDFVGNADRIKMVYDFVGGIGDGGHRDDGDFEVDTRGIDFDLDSEARDILDILKRINIEFYPSYAEASAATRKLGITSGKEYVNRYQEDAHLPSDPRRTYPSEWNGWEHYLNGRISLGFYPSYTEASAATRKLGIRDSHAYANRYHEDARLPSRPNVLYASEWRGWPHYLRGEDKKSLYPTYAKASAATRKLGIETLGEYRDRHKEDVKLPSSPHTVYASEWRGWPHYLRGEDKKSLYPTYAKASAAAKRLRIRTGEEYYKRYKEDPRLPSEPRKTYATEWKGWPHFLQGKEELPLYPTYAEASAAVMRLGIKSHDEYKIRYKEDSRLPSNPNLYYVRDWKGMSIFLTGIGPILPYPTYAEASAAAQELGIKTVDEYRRRYCEDPRFLACPDVRYKKDWKGWPHFLRGKSPFYDTLAEASAATRRMGIEDGTQYKLRYKEDPSLPSNPNNTYATKWKGWPHFLGKTKKPKKS